MGYCIRYIENDRHLPVSLSMYQLSTAAVRTWTWHYLMWHDIYFVAGWCQSILIIMSVCLFVCLSVCPFLAYLKNTGHNFTKYSVRITSSRGSVLLWRQCNMVCTSGFADDVIFWHNGPMGQNQARRYVLSSSPGGGTGGEVWYLRLHCIYCTKKVQDILQPLYPMIWPHLLMVCFLKDIIYLFVPSEVCCIRSYSCLHHQKQPICCYCVTDPSDQLRMHLQEQNISFLCGLFYSILLKFGHYN